MAISKRLRFEVFKRDGFRCVYCGKSPPDVLLEADHINPESKGGTSDINNLITACFDCNRGKRDIALDKAPAQLAENLEILKEKEEQLAEYYKLIKKVERRINKEINQIEIAFQEYFPATFSDSFRNVSLKRFLKVLPLQKLIDFMNKACVLMPDSEQAIKYFCGICWTEIKGK